MRKLLALFLSLLILFPCTNDPAAADENSVYSIDAVDQFCYFWNKYYRENNLDINCGYLLTEDQKQIDSFNIMFNRNNSNFDYQSGIIPSSASLFFLYDPQENVYGLCAFSNDMKSDLEKAVIYTDDGAINNLFPGSSHNEQDMWSITISADDFIGLLNCDQFIVKFIIDGKNEVFDVSKEDYKYLYDLVDWLVKAQLFSDTTYENYLSSTYLPSGTQSPLSLGNKTENNYSFREDLDAIDQAAKSLFYVEIYDDKNNCLGSASGFVAFDEHLFVTNQHVIDKAAYLKIWDEEDNMYVLDTVVMSDKTHDIALLSFPDGKKYITLEMDPDEALKRGQPVVTIGSPKGHQGTVAYGNISALPKIEDFGNIQCIQFTAPISHGSSGGALFDDYGKVIGITSAGDAGGQNINFAIPIKTVKELYEEWNKGEFEILGSKRSWDMVGTTPTPVPTKEPDTAESLPIGVFLNQYGMIKTYVNFRIGPSVNHPKAGDAIHEGKYVYLIINQINSKNEIWTKVNYNGKVGYIKSEHIYTIGEKDSDAYNNAQNSPAPVYTATPAPTSVPKTADELSITTIHNRYGIIKQLVNFRSGPSVNSGLAGDPLNSGDYVYLISNQINAENEIWSKVIVNGKEGYVKSEYIYVLNEDESNKYNESQATPAPVFTATP